METGGAAQEADKNLEMTRTIILFADAARERRHYAIAKSGVRITFAQPRHQLKRHTEPHGTSGIGSREWSSPVTMETRP
jgi:hypothetical protein